MANEYLRQLLITAAKKFSKKNFVSQELSDQHRREDKAYKGNSRASCYHESKWTEYPAGSKYTRNSNSQPAILATHWTCCLLPLLDVSPWAFTGSPSASNTWNKMTLHLDMELLFCSSLRNITFNWKLEVVKWASFTCRHEKMITRALCHSLPIFP